MFINNSVIFGMVTAGTMLSGIQGAHARQIAKSVDELNSPYFTIQDIQPVVYLVGDEKAEKKAYSAIDLKGYSTTGGVTGDLNELTSFTFNYVTNINDFQIKSKNDGVCQDISFINNGYMLSINPSNIDLRTATQCDYSVVDKNNIELSSFSIFLNHTFKYWCQSDSNLPAAVLAKKMSPDCAIAPNTRYLRLKNQNISDLSPVTGFMHLTSLSLANNNISKLNPYLFYQLHGLEFLNILNNNIQFIDKNSFSYLKNIHTLWLGENSISKIEKGAFDNLTNLSWLNLSNNNLSKLPEGLFANNQGLQSIELSDNFLKEFPLQIKDLTDLISFEISNNQLTNVPADVFYKMPKLTNVSLSENNLSQMDPKTFTKNPNLHFFYILGNPFALDFNRDSMDLPESVQIDKVFSSVDNFQ